MNWNKISIRIYEQKQNINIRIMLKTNESVIKLQWIKLRKKYPGIYWNFIFLPWVMMIELSKGRNVFLWIVLPCTVPPWIVLPWTVLNRTALPWIVLPRTVLPCTVLPCTVLPCTVLPWTVLSRIALCQTVLPWYPGKWRKSFSGKNRCL